MCIRDSADAMRQIVEGKNWENMAEAGPKEAEKYALKRVVSMWEKLYGEVAI